MTGRGRERGRTGLVVRAVLAQTAMELRLLARSGESLLVTLGIPLGILVFFSGVDVLPTGDRSAVDFLVPGVLAISVMSTAMVQLAIQTAFERKYGVLKRLGATPLTRPMFLVAKMLAVGAVLVVQTGLVLAVAVVGLGWEPTGSVGPVLVVMLAGAAVFTAIGMLLAGTLRAEATLAVANALYLVLLVVSGMLFAREVLPGALSALGAVLPSGALTTGLRAALRAPAELELGALALLAGWGGACGAVAARTFRWTP